MSELNSKYKQILKDLENNIKDEKQLEFVKEKFADLSMLFIDIIDRLTELTDIRIKDLESTQREIDGKMSRIQNAVDGIQTDIYADDSYEFEVICPYCNYEFVTDVDSDLKDEIDCPECHNIIELDWDSEEQGCNEQCCSHCEESCVREDEEEYGEENKRKTEEDDM